MSATRTGLDELDELLAAATPGPWAEGGGSVEMDEPYELLCPGGSAGQAWTPADAALIVALRNRAPAMLAAIRAAYALAEELEGRQAEALASMRALHLPERAASAEAYGYRANAYASAADRLRAALDEALGATGE